jgi:DNA-damage-inducible protein J
MATTMVHIRVDEKVKARAAKTLAAMGLSVSDAVRVMLVRVAAEKRLPFEVKVPNPTTVRAMKAADRGRSASVGLSGLCEYQPARRPQLNSEKTNPPASPSRK